MNDRINSDRINLKRLARSSTGWIVTALLAASMIVPFLWMLSTSLKPDAQLLVFPPRLLSSEFSFASYTRLLELFPMARMFFNSLVVTAASTIGQLIICSMAAYAFARIPFRGRSLLFLLFLATLMVPLQVILTPLFIEMRMLGWVNSYAGIVFPTMTIRVAFGVFLLRQAFAAIPEALEESAFMDGATYGTIFARVALPLVRPALATLVVLAFMDAWNALLWPLLVVRDTNMMTLPVGLSALHGRYSTAWNMVMAGVVISVLPIIAIFIGAQRHFIEGMARAGIKS